MPRLSNHHVQEIVKMMYLGDTSAGKTGSLSALANAGFNLRVLDFDNGLDSLFHYTKPEARDNVIYEGCFDKFKNVSGRAQVDGIPQAWKKCLALLTHWKRPLTGEKLIDGKLADGSEPYDLGKPSTWTPKEVLIIDSGTFAGMACLREALIINGKPTSERPSLPDWGTAQSMFEEMLQMLYSDIIKCNVIITFHIKFRDTPEGQMEGLPTGLGKDQPPKLGRYFNTVVRAKSKGRGDNAKRIIQTSSSGMVEMKVPVPPGKLPAELPLDTGLATLFQRIREG